MGRLPGRGEQEGHLGGAAEVLPPEPGQAVYLHIAAGERKYVDAFNMLMFLFQGACDLKSIDHNYSSVSVTEIKKS